MRKGDKRNIESVEKKGSGREWNDCKRYGVQTIGNPHEEETSDDTETTARSNMDCGSVKTERGNILISDG
jgi:hypothetical protein